MAQSLSRGDIGDEELLAMISSEAEKGEKPDAAEATPA